METTAPLSYSRGEEGKKALTVNSEKKNSWFFFKKKSSEKESVTTKDFLLFIVDDDPLYSKALENSISSKLPDIKIKTFFTGEACLQQLKQKPDVVILDYFLDSKIPYAWNGLNILKQIKMLNPKTKVIVLSSQNSLDVATKLTDTGSFDYISKSESSFGKINSELKSIIENINARYIGKKQYQIIGGIVIVMLIIFYIFIKLFYTYFKS